MTPALFGIAAAAFLVAVATAPAAKKIMRRIGLVDRPDAERKLHARSVPLAGGTVLLVTLFVTVGAATALGLLWPGAALLRHSELTGVLGGVLVLFFVGILDDARGLRGRQKLLGQAAAVSLIIASGLSIETITLFDWRLELGICAAPFTLLWLLGAINALNLIDGADGLASTIGIVISAALAAMAALSGNATEALLAAALAGALAGFLVYNFPPASMFLGDSGSMVVGLLLGVLAIRSSLKGPATVALAAPLAMLAIPFFDTTAALLRRSLTGRSIYTTDRGHLHHVLLERGMTVRGMLLCVALLCVLTAGGGLISVYLNSELFALVSFLAVIATLVVFRIFGFAEMMLTTNRLFRFVESLLSTAQQQPGVIRQQTVRLQGSRNWDELWNALTDFAERHELCKVELELNIAWLHEGFLSTWECPTTTDARDMWSTKLPVAAFGRTVGRLTIGGPLTKHSIYTLLSLLAEMMESLEPCIQRLAEELPQSAAKRRPGFPQVAQPTADVPAGGAA